MKVGQKVSVIDCTRYQHRLKVGTIGTVKEVGDNWILVEGTSATKGDTILQNLHPCDVVSLDETTNEVALDALIETFKASDYTELEIIAYLEGYKAGCEASERK